MWDGGERQPFTIEVVMSRGNRRMLIAVSLLTATMGTLGFAQRQEAYPEMCGSMIDINGCPSPEFDCVDMCGENWAHVYPRCEGEVMQCWGEYVGP